MAQQASNPKCPQCGAAMTVEQKTLAGNPHFPFCSKRCKMADLDRWFSDSYRISQTIDELTSEQLIEIATEEPAATDDTERNE
jgi:endogenous inhibitor of DNA gyrase (YacG/DUF329 family)